MLRRHFLFALLLAGMLPLADGAWASDEDGDRTIPAAGLTIPAAARIVQGPAAMTMMMTTKR